MGKNVGMMQKVGSWAFIVGVVIALIAGFWPLNAVVTSVLLILGLIVGFLNVSGSETMPFLLASVSLVIVSSFGGNLLGAIQVVGPKIQAVLTTLVNFVIPATIVVALKAIYALAKDD
jgi:hypothetical protein